MRNRKCACCDELHPEDGMMQCKDGYVCHDCLEKVPFCTREELDMLTGEQVKIVMGMFHKSTSPVWLREGWLGLSDHSIHFGDLEIELSKIKEVKPDFIPFERRGDKIAVRYVFSMTTKSPVVEFRQELYDHLIEADYEYDEKECEFSFWYTGNTYMRHIFNIINTAAQGNCDLSEERKSYENYKRRHKNEKTTVDFTYAEKEAMAVLELKADAGFSEEDLKKHYRTLMKLHHPDSNDNSEESKEKTQQIKEAYELLKKRFE